MAGSLINYTFTNHSLLMQALRHRSAGPPHNERLEFLGDSIVNLLVAEVLYQRWPQANEGFLTRARSELVRESAMATLARKLEIGVQLILGPGELKSGGYRRDSILADTLEAIIAAIYLDGGYEVCRSVVLPWFEEAFTTLAHTQLKKDPKTRLQEWLQARQKSLPEYLLLGEDGDDHAKLFRVKCRLATMDRHALAEGPSRRHAEQKAAAQLLQELEQSS